MAKRAACSQITADNWEDEVEEEAGSFAKANETEIRARLIKKAKRSTGALSTGGLFKEVKLCSNGSTHVSSNNTEDDYLHQLECLNTSVAEWISQHVQRNPLVDLTPIFRDYEAHLKSLDQKKKQTINVENLSVAEDTTPPLITQPVQTTITKVATKSDNSNIVDHVIPTVAPAVSATEEDASQDNEDDILINASPKPSADQPIEDDSSLLAVRSKLFYKKNDSYVELGVGILRVQEDLSKAKLLMRNDTKLGNILLNISLTPQLPVSRAGKNNVLLMCPPNPPLELKPTNQNEETPSTQPGDVVTYLMRVKTGQLADQLFEQIKAVQSKLS